MVNTGECASTVLHVDDRTSDRNTTTFDPGHEVIAPCQCTFNLRERRARRSWHHDTLLLAHCYATVLRMHTMGECVSASHYLPAMLLYSITVQYRGTDPPYLCAI